MLLAGLGVSNEPSASDEQPSIQELVVQQIKITDAEGNLKNVYPSKTDLQFDESANIVVERE